MKYYPLFPCYASFLPFCRQPTTIRHPPTMRHGEVLFGKFIIALICQFVHTGWLDRWDADSKQRQIYGPNSELVHFI